MGASTRRCPGGGQVGRYYVGTVQITTALPASSVPREPDCFLGTPQWHGLSRAAEVVFSQMMQNCLVSFKDRSNSVLLPA
jgi:hypothetical protein